MPRRSPLALVALCLVLAAAGRAPAVPSPTPFVAPRLADFSPRGTVKQVRQAVARFATPMVAYGDPKAADPLSAECPVAGTGRWLDARTWVYDFVRTLPGGVRCAFRLRPGLADLAGAALPAGGDLAFDTGGPAIVSSMPSAGETIDAEQALLLRLDAEPTADSVARHASFSIDGVAERIDVRVVEGAERAQIVERFASGDEDDVELVLAARRRFPDGAGVRLVWGAGIATAGGAATSEDQTLEFTVRAAFTAEMRCQRESARTDCIPLTPIVLRFSAPVPWADASRVTLTAPEGRSFAPVPPDGAEQAVSQVVFRGPFPARTTLRLAVPGDLKDDAGRTLANASELRDLPVVLGADPPLAKFASRFAIVELAADPALPVTIRSLGTRVTTRELHLAASGGRGSAADARPAATVRGEMLYVGAERSAEILGWLRKVGAARRDRSVFGEPRGVPAGGRVESLALPELSGEELQVVGIPLPAPGLYVVEIESQRLGEALLDGPKPLYVPAAALVTDMAVHLEWSSRGSLVWVTRLSNGRPVAGAQVAVHDCGGRVLAKAETDGQGVARVAGLPDRDAVPLCRSSNDDSDEHHDYRASRSLSDLDGGLFVTAREGDDLSFVHSSWDLGIEPYRFDLPEEPWNGPFVAHAVLDRPLLRAGETVHMKHLFREQTLQGFAVVDAAASPQRLSIRHLGSDTRHELPLAWRADGSAVTDWPIPKEAKLGLYEVYYVREAAPAPAASPEPSPTPPAPYVRLGAPPTTYDREWLAGTFRVAEFRVPLARGVVKLPAEPQVAAPAVHADLAVQYLAGGGAADLPVVLRSQIEPDEVRVKGHADSSFANGPVKVGIRREGDGADEPEARRTDGTIHSREELRLDAAGTARATIAGLPAVEQPKRLRAELEFRDPNGEVQTAVATVPLWPARVVAGVEASVRDTRAPRLVARALVLDPHMQPAPRVRVQVEAFERRNYTVRKRLVGGFYGYDYVEDTRPL
ncbi:MAG: MG2 domain-containing protein, partial [Thermodesulfobacteriota bacterium]